LPFPRRAVRIRLLPLHGDSKSACERLDSKFSDPNASCGHRSAVSTRSVGAFYGYKLDLAVCTATDLPVAWNIRTARMPVMAPPVALHVRSAASAASCISAYEVGDAGNRSPPLV
jgi:hypothetical protein